MCYNLSMQAKLKKATGYNQFNYAVKRVVTKKFSLSGTTTCCATGTCS